MIDYITVHEQIKKKKKNECYFPLFDEFLVFEGHLLSKSIYGIMTFTLCHNDDSAAPLTSFIKLYNTINSIHIIPFLPRYSATPEQNV